MKTIIQAVALLLVMMAPVHPAFAMTSAEQAGLISFIHEHKMVRSIRHHYDPSTNKATIRWQYFETALCFKGSCPNIKGWGIQRWMRGSSQRIHPNRWATSHPAVRDHSTYFSPHKRGWVEYAVVARIEWAGFTLDIPFRGADSINARPSVGGDGEGTEGGGSVDIDSSPQASTSTSNDYSQMSVRELLGLIGKMQAKIDALELALEKMRPPEVRADNGASIDDQSTSGFYKGISWEADVYDLRYERTFGEHQFIFMFQHDYHPTATNQPESDITIKMPVVAGIRFEPDAVKVTPKQFRDGGTRFTISTFKDGSYNGLGSIWEFKMIGGIVGTIYIPTKHLDSIQPAKSPIQDAKDWTSECTEGFMIVDTGGTSRCVQNMMLTSKVAGVRSGGRKHHLADTGMMSMHIPGQSTTTKLYIRCGSSVSEAGSLADDIGGCDDILAECYVGAYADKPFTGRIDLEKGKRSFISPSVISSWGLGNKASATIGDNEFGAKMYGCKFHSWEPLTIWWENSYTTP